MLGGESVKETCRRPEIMADAAHVILNRDSKTATGNFYVDEAVLKEEGVNDFDKYAFVPGKDFNADLWGGGTH